MTTPQGAWGPATGPDLTKPVAAAGGQPAVPPGWYPGPNGPVQWWDGLRWGPPAPPASDTSTTWAVFAHVGGLLLGFLAPLIILLTEGRKSRFVKHHATEALNLHITVALAMIALFVVYLVGIVVTIGGAVTAGSADAGAGAGIFAGGFFVVIMVFVVAFFAIYVYSIVVAIVAAVKAGRREYWRYPVNIRFVRGAASKAEVAELNASVSR